MLQLTCPPARTCSLEPKVARPRFRNLDGEAPTRGGASIEPFRSAAQDVALQPSRSLPTSMLTVARREGTAADMPVLGTRRLHRDEESGMNEFRSTEQAGFYAAMDSAAFCFAFTEHTLKNVSALADSMVAALCSAGEANTQMLINVREDLAQRIAAAGALASAAAGGDLLIA